MGPTHRAPTPRSMHRMPRHLEHAFHPLGPPITPAPPHVRACCGGVRWCLRSGTPTPLACLTPHPAQPRHEHARSVCCRAHLQGQAHRRPPGLGPHQRHGRSEEAGGRQSSSSSSSWGAEIAVRPRPPPPPAAAGLTWVRAAVPGPASGLHLCHLLAGGPYAPSRLVCTCTLALGSLGSCNCSAAQRPARQGCAGMAARALPPPPATSRTHLDFCLNNMPQHVAGQQAGVRGRNRAQICCACGAATDPAAARHPPWSAHQGRAQTPHILRSIVYTPARSWGQRNEPKRAWGPEIPAGRAPAGPDLPGPGCARYLRAGTGGQAAARPDREFAARSRPGSLRNACRACIERSVQRRANLSNARVGLGAAATLAWLPRPQPAPPGRPLSRRGPRISIRHASGAALPTLRLRRAGARGLPAWERRTVQT